MSEQPHPNTATVFDSILRWLVPSRSDPNDTYAVDLGAYNGEGRCACQDFSMRYEKYLARGMTPQQVWDEKWLEVSPDKPQKLRPYQLGPEDCCSCFHLVDARRMAARQCIRAFTIAKKAQNSAG